MEYRIGELAGLAGCSTDLIRYYERIGLLTPVYGNNGYRIYNDSDLFTLLRVRIMRGLDFPLEVIAGEESGLAQKQDHLHSFLMSKLDEIGSNIDQLQERLTRLQTVFNNSKECALFLNQVALCVVPATYRLMLRKPFDEATKRTVQNWMSHSEYVLTAYHIPASSLYEEGPLTIHGGLSMLKTNADRCGVSTKAPVDFYPREKGLMTILAVPDPANPTRDDLKPLVDYVSKNQYTLTGEMYSLNLAVTPVKAPLHYIKVQASIM